MLFDPVGSLIDEISWKKSASGAWLFNPDSLVDGLEAQVLYVVDGDTVVVSIDDKRFTIRLLGVDTPETVHPFKPIEYYGRQASDFLKNLLTDQSVSLEFDENKIDKYGRVLAYIHLDDFFVNAEIIKQGYGYAYTRFPFKYMEEFVLYEAMAKDQEMGIWQNLKVRSIIEMEAELDEEILPFEVDEALLIFEEEVLLSEEALEGFIEPEPLPDCRSEFLKIDSFLPNAQKGYSTEYIRLINEGSETVCFSGWHLDDKIDGGSKPFAIKGGSIAPGGVRTFRRQETGLALNNRDDCVTLIDQDGKVADQICYEGTHKNEIFTHAGGDWVPKKRTKKRVVKTSSVRHSFKRDLISYQSELQTVYYIGRVITIDEELERLNFEPEGRDQIIINYANSPVNMSMTKVLVDLSKPIEIQVYEVGNEKNLVSIMPITEPTTLKKQSGSLQVQFLLVLLFATSVGLLIFRKSK